MSNQIDSPKAPRLANFGRLPGGFHSVTKLTPFCIAFRVNFGGQNPPKIGEISGFGPLCFTSSFRAPNSMIFGGLQGWKTLVLLSKNKVFHEICFSPTGTFFGRFSTPKLLQKPWNLASRCSRFFDFVFKANFNDFGVQFGGPKIMKFWENHDFWATLVGALPWYCHLLRFQSNFEVPRGQNSWILVSETCQIWEFAVEICTQSLN